MTTLTDLLDRKRALEEQEARIQRDLGILRQIDELAAQLDEPSPNGAVSVAADREEQKAATPAPAPAPPAPPPPPKPPAPPGTGEPEVRVEPKSKTRVSSGQRERVLDTLRREFRGVALQVDLTKKTGLNSGTVAVICRTLAEEGVIRPAGKGGYMNKSTRWKLVEQEPESEGPVGVTAKPSVGVKPPAPPPAPTLSSRVRKQMERDAKKKGPTQPPTHEGRILSLLLLRPMSVAEMAAELSIPASTVGRLVGKLKGEGEVVDPDGGGIYRRVMS